MFTIKFVLAFALTISATFGYTWNSNNNYYQGDDYELYMYDNVDISNNDWFDQSIWDDIEILTAPDNRRIVKKCAEKYCYCAFMSGRRYRYSCNMNRFGAASRYNYNNIHYYDDDNDVKDEYDMMMAPANLRMHNGGRSGNPQSARGYTAQNANVDLTAQGAGAGFTVQLSMHHVCDWGTFTAFWNQLTEEGHVKSLCNVLNELNKNIPGKFPGIALPVPVQTLITGICDGTITHDATAVADPGIGGLTEAWQWMPGNLFVGPERAKRTDDPADVGGNFESGSKKVLGSAYKNMERACKAMAGYYRLHDKKKKKAVASIAIALLKAATPNNVYQLDNSKWKQERKGKYSLKK
eukprot:316501_1